MWNINSNGFLPNIFPVNNYLPYFVDNGLFHANRNIHQEYLFRTLCYMASAYVHSGDKSSKIPSYIAVPLVHLSKELKRPPILSYASYCLYNWELINDKAPVKLGNIQLIQNFTEEYKRDEDWFILIHVDIEARAAEGVSAILANQTGTKSLLDTLKSLHNSLINMNITMARMPEKCDPDIYYKHVRPYIFGFKDVVYSGCFNEEPQNFRGETGAQSSIIPAFINFLGIKHQNSMLVQHLEDMKKYMPAKHVIFINNIQSIRDQVDDTTKELYNACIEEVIKFRNKHFEYAVNYIEKKVENPTGTGGTPYIPWLKQLVEETESFIIK